MTGVLQNNGISVKNLRRSEQKTSLEKSAFFHSILWLKGEIISCGSDRLENSDDNSTVHFGVFRIIQLIQRITSVYFGQYGSLRGICGASHLPDNLFLVAATNWRILTIHVIQLFTSGYLG
jgi:hypothetical protein